LPEIDKETQERAQEVMKDHLSIMRDVVMKIRHQEGYAKAMYANCPRLQHLLDKNPDLRPVFEDPRLVRINFETVYKEAGGILPEDEEEEERKRNNPSLIMRIANHPIFKFLKVLIFVKKIIGCIAGGGIALVSSCWTCMADCCTDCCCEEAVEEVGEVDEWDEENEYGLEDAAMDENQKALNTAADYMEDPEVQEQMQRLLEDPENLEDAIENDAELRALRDSNPLCAELMQDPETMKILTDPDNLRALGEAPQMIELDFNDPHGFNPQSDFVDVEAGELDGLEASEDFLETSGSMDGLEAYDADYDENEVYFPMEDEGLELGESIMEEGGFEDEGLGDEQIEMTELEDPAAEVPAEQQATSGWEDDFELEQQEVEVEGGDGNAEAANKGKANQKAQNKKNQTATTEKKGGMAGVITSFGVAATDVIAAQIVGEVFGADFLPGDLLGGGGDLDLGGLDAAADNADALVNDDVADLAEDTADDIDDTRDNADGGDGKDGGKQQGRASIDSMGRKNYVGLMGAGAGGLGVAGAAAVATSSLGPMRDVSDSEADSLDDGLRSIGDDSSESERFDDEDSQASSEKEKEEEKKPESKFFGAFKNLASATVTAAKEAAAGALIGDDLAEMLVEKQEEMGESSSDDEDDKKKDKKKKRFRLFGRKKEEEESAEFSISQELTFQPNEEEINPNYGQDYSSSVNTDEMYNSSLNASIPIPEYGSSFNLNASAPIPEYSSASSQMNSSSNMEEGVANFYKSNPEYTNEQQADADFYEANPEYTSPMSTPTHSFNNKLDNDNNKNNNNDSTSSGGFWS